MIRSVKEVGGKHNIYRVFSGEDGKGISAHPNREKKVAHIETEPEGGRFGTHGRWKLPKGAIAIGTGNGNNDK